MKKTGRLIKISLGFTFVLFLSIPLYIIFINNYVTRAHYINKINEQIELTEKGGVSGSDYASEPRVFQINSIEGKKYILSVLESSTPNYGSNIVRLGQRDSYIIQMGDIQIKIFYSGTSVNKKSIGIELFGYHVNEYMLHDENEDLFTYLMSLYQ
jgi:hypothetical protein